MANTIADAIIESQHPGPSKELMSFQTPWLDLPIPITELILERLPPSDYIRFASVCKDWLSIQKRHRIHHSPLPPPMQKTIPWLFPCLPVERKKFLCCFSPSEKKCYPFIFLKKDKCEVNDLASSHGWFFLSDKRVSRISLFNPLSKSNIKLPPFKTKLWYTVRGILSASPLSPHCVAFILDVYCRRVLLCRLGQKQSKWTLLRVPPDYNSCLYCYPFIRNSVYCNGKFYFTYGNLFVVDSVSTTPTIQALNMDCSQFSYKLYRYQTFVESDGELLIVLSMYDKPKNRIFEVFKADFSRMTWVRVNSIGDRALFLGRTSSLCVSASEVGCKSNCAYFLDQVEDGHDVDIVAWSLFNMDIINERTQIPLSPCEKSYFLKMRCELSFRFDCFGHWFLPSLDYQV